VKQYRRTERSQAAQVLQVHRARQIPQKL
jgi:hypothetical protein